MRSLAEFGKFLGRAFLVAAGVIGLGWVLAMVCWLFKWVGTILAFICDKISAASIWLMDRLSGAWDLFLPNWVTYVILAALAAIVWTVAEICFAHHKKQKLAQNKPKEEGN